MSRVQSFIYFGGYFLMILSVALIAVIIACFAISMGPSLPHLFKRSRKADKTLSIAFEQQVNLDLNQAQAGVLLQIEIINFRHTLHSLGAKNTEHWLYAIFEAVEEAFPQLLWRFNENGRFLAWHKQPGLGQELAQQIVEKLDQGFEVEATKTYPRIAIGYVDRQQSSAALGTWIAQADCAALMATNRNQNIAQYDISMDIGMIDKQAIASRFREALDANQLDIHYQPIVDVVSGLPVALEALLRWPQDDGQINLPKYFLDSARLAGRMQGVTDWVLDESLPLLKKTHQMGAMLNLHINLSAEDLSDIELADRLSKVLSDYQIDGRYLRLEISAAELAQHRSISEKQGDALSALGIQLVVDDFGYSHTSMSAFNLLPLSNLKLDRSFVTGMEANDHDLAVVKSAIYLSNSIKVPIIASGVENAEQAAYLFKFGCTLMQGYWFAKPMAKQSILRWLSQTWSPNNNASGNSSKWRNFSG